MADVDNTASYAGLQKFIPPFVISYAMLVMMFLVHSRLMAEPTHMAYFFLLCYVGGIAAVTACRSGIVFKLDSAYPILVAVSHMKQERTRYLAVLVISIVLYQEWNNPDHHRDNTSTNDAAFRSCTTMLILGFVVQFVGKYLGELIGGQRMRGRNAGEAIPDGVGAGHPEIPGRSRLWKSLWELGITGVAFGFTTATTVASGGAALPLYLSIAGGIAGAMREAAPNVMGIARYVEQVCTGRRPAYPPVPRDLAERVFVQLRIVPMYVILSPVVMPATGLLITYTRVCYWPKPSTQWLTFLLRVAEITVCVMHIGRSPVNGGDAPAGDGSPWQKTITCLLSFVGWICLLCCACILEPGPFGGALVMIVVSIVALNTPHEKVWRGCILLFWIALVCVILSAPINEVIQARKVYKAYRALHIFNGDGNHFDLGNFLSAVREVPKDWHFGEMALCPVGTAKPRR